ncbi:toll/interleukin-1 receptor domain-containing protein [Arsukibacterium sp.]|uniref:toll/interleukin-1 receptor domain-containing protein n=1 Tax=Arsukibacterium sp. TaxID=1977258 RepID=UPI001BD429D3|nr:toll/interleukin-1 receptor domain-containing protein [Arsukibacterium sp.]
MAEYLARVSWDSIQRYKLLQRSSDSPSPSRLSLTGQYGSGQPILAKLRFGDGLWLFTAPEFGNGNQRRTLPPSVLGRISITHQRFPKTGAVQLAAGTPPQAQPLADITVNAMTTDYNYWCGGDVGLALPIHNAYAVFKNLTFTGTRNHTIASCVRCQQAAVPATGPYGHLMQHFQSIRRLSAESATQLMQLQNMVACRRTVFLSHRHCEASNLVSEVATTLQKKDALCWWDVQVMPQSRWYDDKILVPMLKDGIRQAALFIAFITPGYLEPGWAKEEFDEALRANGPIIVQVLLGGTIHQQQHIHELGNIQQTIDVGADASSIADSILQRLDVLNPDL